MRTVVWHNRLHIGLTLTCFNEFEVLVYRVTSKVSRIEHLLLPRMGGNGARLYVNLSYTFRLPMKLTLCSVMSYSWLKFHTDHLPNQRRNDISWRKVIWSKQTSTELASTEILHKTIRETLWNSYNTTRFPSLSCIGNDRKFHMRCCI